MAKRRLTKKQMQRLEGIKLVPADGQRLPPELAGISVTWKVLNAADGRQLLKKNEGNRNISYHRVRQYLSEMLVPDGWKINGTTILRDTDGNLMDGQQRATAAARLPQDNQGQWVLRVDGLDPSVRSTIDTGRARSFGDVLKFAGESNTLLMAAIIRRAYVWEVLGVRWDSTRMRASFDGMYRYMSGDPEVGLPDNTELVRWVCDLVVSDKNMLVDYISPSTYGFMIYMCSLVSSREQAVEFWQKGFAQCDSIPRSHPAQRLRKSIRRQTGGRRYDDDPAVLCYAIAAWNEFFTGEWGDGYAITAPRGGWNSRNMPKLLPDEGRDRYAVHQPGDGWNSQDRLPGERHDYSIDDFNPEEYETPDEDLSPQDHP